MPHDPGDTHDGPFGPAPGSHLPVSHQERERTFAELSLRDFDPLYYLARNFDLAQAFGTNQSAAAKHYVQNGVHELRSPNPFFEPEFYRSIHPDLQSHDALALLLHWYTYGVDEGRQGSKWFSLTHYLQSHDDLVHAFGNDFGAAFEHWKSFGHTERRQTVPGQFLQIYWGDIDTASGARLLADGSGECVPEEPVHEEPSTGRILGFACKRLVPGFIGRAACKWAIGKVWKSTQAGVVICDPDGSGQVRVHDEPIFRGDINVPDDIGAIA